VIGKYWFVFGNVDKPEEMRVAAGLEVGEMWVTAMVMG